MSEMTSAHREKLMTDLRTVIADAEEVLRVTADQATRRRLGTARAHAGAAAAGQGPAARPAGRGRGACQRRRPCGRRLRARASLEGHRRRRRHRHDHRPAHRPPLGRAARHARVARWAVRFAAPAAAHRARAGAGAAGVAGLPTCSSKSCGCSRRRCALLLGLMLLGLGLVLLIAFLLLLLWDGYRLPALGVLTLLCVCGGAAAAAGRQAPLQPGRRDVRRHPRRTRARPGRAAAAGLKARGTQRHDELLRRRERLLMRSGQLRQDWSRRCRCCARRSAWPTRRAPPPPGWCSNPNGRWARCGAGRCCARAACCAGPAMPGRAGRVPARAAADGQRTPRRRAEHGAAPWRPSGEARGIQFPLDGSGKRSSARVGRGILAAALRVLDASAAERCLAERDWRHAYPVHLRRLVELQAAQPQATVASCRAGLDAAWEALVFVRDGQPLPLRQAMATPPAPALRTLRLRGAGRQRAGALGSAVQGPAPERRCAGAAHRCLGRGRHHRGIARRRRCTWRARIPSGSTCRIGTWCCWVRAARPGRWPGWPPGAPTSWPSTWRARPPGRRSRSACAPATATLIAPVAATAQLGGDAEQDMALAGADMLTQTPEIAHWLAQLGQPLDLFSIAYLDGERHVRVSLAMDAIARGMRAADARCTLRLDGHADRRVRGAAGAGRGRDARLRRARRAQAPGAGRRACRQRRAQLRAAHRRPGRCRPTASAGAWSMAW